jgi:transcriptional regulator with XRE-family HTH domain
MINKGLDRGRVESKLELMRVFQIPKSLTVREMSRKAGISEVYGSYILNGHKRPSPSVAIRLEEASGGALTKAMLRPDLWGPAATKSQKKAPVRPGA